MRALSAPDEWITLAEAGARTPHARTEPARTRAMARSHDDVSGVRMRCDSYVPFASSLNLAFS